MNKLGEDFLVEKYKYVLSRKTQLNEVTFKLIALFQVVVFALCFAFYNIYATYKNGVLSKELASLFCTSIIILHIAFSMLIVIMIIGGVFSWLKYRRDENDLIKKVFNEVRDKIAIISIFSWYETYAVLFIIALGIYFVSVYYLNYDILFM